MKKPWYKNWWGVLLAICIWPYFLIWYVWAKTKWPAPGKVGATIGLALAAIISLGVFASSQPQSSSVAAKTSPSPSASATNKPSPSATPTPKATPKPTPKVATRQVSGTATTLGAGTFTGGKDVAAGLYDVTTGVGQSGNFMVDGADSYNEILGVAEGQGVPKIRVTISGGDTITISSLSRVVFTPVTTPFVTAHATTSLYAGTFTVGEDIGAGRYVATPGAGQSGNFMVDGSNTYNEILGGDSSLGGVPSLTVNLTNGDIITISSLSLVTLTPNN